MRLTPEEADFFTQYKRLPETVRAAVRRIVDAIADAAH